MSTHTSEDGASAGAPTGDSPLPVESAGAENLLPETPGRATNTTTSTNSPTGDVHVHVERVPADSPRGDGEGFPPEQKLQFCKINL